MKTKGEQLVEACRAHGSSDAELGAAIDQALSEAQEQLRDRFAMAALTGLLAQPESEDDKWPDGVGESHEKVRAYLCKVAYQYSADALAARKVTP